MHISIPMVYIILRGCLSSKIIKISIVRIQRFVKDFGAARLSVDLPIFFFYTGGKERSVFRVHPAVEKSEYAYHL